MQKRFRFGAMALVTALLLFVWTGCDKSSDDSKETGGVVSSTTVEPSNPFPSQTSSERPENTPTAGETPGPTEGTLSDTPTPTEHSTTPVTPEAPLPTEAPRVTDSPTKKPTATPKPTKKPTATSKPTKKPTATPKVTKKPTASPTITPKGTPALTNEWHYLRTEPGRQKERLGKLPFRARVTIQDTVVTEWNEVWHKVIAEIDGVQMEGYVQDAAVVPGLTPQPTKKATGLTPVPANGKELSEHHGADRDGDGVYVVVLDPGHGDRYSGATHYGTMEKEINLKVAQRVKAYLEARYQNVKVYMTRNNDRVFDTVDTIDDIEYRVQYAIEKKADILVSCHFNAGGGRGGAMVLVPRKANVARRSAVLGTYLMDELCKLGLQDRGVRKRISPNSRYLDGTPMDGYLLNRLAAEKGLVNVIIEHCYMDVASDRKFWDQEGDLTALAWADGRAIAAYLDLTPIGATPTKAPTKAPTVIPTTMPTATPTQIPTPSTDLTTIPTIVVSPTPMSAPTEGK